MKRWWGESLLTRGEVILINVLNVSYEIGSDFQPFYMQSEERAIVQMFLVSYGN